MEEEDMEDHRNIYLYVLVEAVSDSKLSLEFTFTEEETDNVKMLSSDSLEHVSLPAKSEKIFFTSIEQPFEIKVLRNNGFPFYHDKTCKKDIEKCVDDFKDDDEKGKQILTKVAAYSGTPCPNCFQMIKISTEEDPAEVDIHIQSELSEIELTESKPAYDFT